MVDWNEVIGDALTQLLRIMIPVALMLFMKWAAEFWGKLREKNPKLAELIAVAGQIGYAAAEEYFRNSSVSGEDKMQYAIKHANAYLNTLGIHIDLNVIRDSIIEYGVTHYRFSWTKPEMAEMIAELKERIDNTGEGEDEEEDDHESGMADDMCIGCSDTDHDTDHHADREQPVQPDEKLAADKG